MQDHDNSQDRARDQIGDAAISILAIGGISALTEGALDAELNWPVGTTAALGLDLVEVAAQRLILLDGARFSRFRGTIASIAALLDDAEDSHARTRLMARLELFLYAARSPKFETIRWARELLLAGAEAQFRIRRVRAASLAAVAVVALVEGLELNRLLGGTRLDSWTRYALIRNVLRGFSGDSKGRVEHS
jgi:hypothetical protein